MNGIPSTAPLRCVVTLFDGETVLLTGVTRVEEQRDREEIDNRDGASSYSIFQPRPTGSLLVDHDGGVYSVPLEFVTTVTYSR